MITVEMEVCDECHKESGELLFKSLLTKYGFPQNQYQIPGNHPIWKEYNEQREVLKVKCIRFDCLVNLCKTHIMEYVNQL